MKFNINDTVRVRLTQFGKDMLLKDHNTMYGSSPVNYSFPKEDSEGYSEWPLWELMQDLGKYVNLGYTLPFEVIIEL